VFQTGNLSIQDLQVQKFFLVFGRSFH